MEALGRAFNLSAGEQSYLLTCDRGQGILSIGTERAALQVVASESEHRLATSDPAEIAAMRGAAELMLRKVAAGIGLMLLIPVLVLAAAAGSFGGERGALRPPGACSAPRSRPGRPSPQTYAVGSGQGRNSRPCQAGELEAMVLSHPRIHLGSLAVGDVAEGRVDPRVLQVLLFLAERHDLGSVGPLITGHSYFVAGTTSPSNHAFGRAVDISVIDGQAVSIYNAAARDAMEMVLSLPPAAASRRARRSVAPLPSLVGVPCSRGTTATTCTSGGTSDEDPQARRASHPVPAGPRGGASGGDRGGCWTRSRSCSLRSVSRERCLPDGGSGSSGGTAG